MSRGHVSDRQGRYNGGMADAARDSRPAEALLHPGGLFIASLAVSWMLEAIASLRIDTRIDRLPGQISVAILFLGGGAVLAWSLVTFRSRATSPEPLSAPAALITEGPFRWSRNPMYVALLCFSLSIAIIAGSAWFFGATAALAAILDRIVIAREEKVMTETFGPAFEAYRTRVRRWV